MKLTSAFIVLALASTAYTLSQEAPDDVQLDVVEDNSDFLIDMRIPTLNAIFREMNAGESRDIEKANHSIMRLVKETKRKLIAEFLVYDPLTEEHQLALKNTYIYNFKVKSLIAKVCKEHDVEIRPPTVSSECETSIFKASKIIGLELTGTIDIEGYQAENLEKCIAAKLPPKIVNSNYMTCFINIVGDKKYAEEELRKKIEEKEAEGFHCTPQGKCVRSEDPDIMNQLLDKNYDPSIPVKVDGDDRPRHCDVLTHPLMLKSENNLVPYLRSYVYPCKNWVKNIYCEADGESLFFSIEYTDKEGHSETFRPKPFDENSAKKIRVNYRSGQRIHFARFFSFPGSLVLKELEMEMSDGSIKVCKLNPQHRVPRKDLNKLEIGFAGEFAGMEYQVVSSGLRIASVYERN